MVGRTRLNYKFLSLLSSEYSLPAQLRWGAIVTQRGSAVQ